MLLTDQILFPAIQLLLIVAAFVAFIGRFFQRRSQRNTRINATVTRGPESMAKFYGAYGVLTGIFVTLCAIVDAAEGYRTILILLDVTLVAYLCLWNGWSRTRIIKFTNMLPTREFK